MHLAVNLADRFLVVEALSNEDVPCLVTLVATCCLVAAKLEQPMHPSFNAMVELVNTCYA